ncbi:MAG TPA: hypothetical protein P5186_24210 [Candidatus Paceibacterota bacterium]|nr:hypothetical protein [Candidatus Paceibacterota bacterium]
MSTAASNRNQFLTMTDWCDKVISTLGLDGCRMDPLFGVVEKELGGLDALQGSFEVRMSLNRLPNDRRLLMFQFGPWSDGWFWPIPCSSANAQVLDEFLRCAETFIPPSDAPQAAKRGVLNSLRAWSTRFQPVAVKAPFVHRHANVRIELRLLSKKGSGHVLQFLGRAYGGHCDHAWRWSGAVASIWQGILAHLRTGIRDWPAKQSEA